METGSPAAKRQRKIPEIFSCERVDGTKCKFQTEFEVVFREHILTHIAEKLRDKHLLDWHSLCFS